MQVEHRLPVEPKVANLRPWVKEIVIVVVQQADQSALLVVVIGCIAGLVVICVGTVFIVYLLRARPKSPNPALGIPEQSAFRGIKML
jgi:hypothetical protein